MCILSNLSCNFDCPLCSQYPSPPHFFFYYFHGATSISLLHTHHTEAEEHGFVRKSGGSSSPGEGMLDKSGPGESRRWLRGDLDMFDMNMNLSGGSKSSKSGAGGSKSGKSASCKSKSGKAAKAFPADGDALKAAVRDYVTQECAPRNGTCFVAQQWGFPMNEWDVSQVTDMSGLFSDSQGLFEDFNENLICWDTGSVTDMSFMFFEAREFNQPLSHWNVEQVKDMALMFKDAQSFDQDISNWKFDDIERMTSMLDGAKSFEQNLCAWGKQPAVQLALSSGNAKDIFTDSGCLLQVTSQDEDGPFCAPCKDFTSLPADGEALKAAVRDYVTQKCADNNGACVVAQQWGFPISKWDVSQVTDMSELFHDPQGLFKDFNEGITGWDIGRVKDMSFMFKDAQKFDQDISNWKFDDIVRMTSMLDGAGSFEQNLCAWGEQPAVLLALSSGNAKDIFRDSGCKLQVTPQNDDGPFCASCSDNGNGVRV